MMLLFLPISGLFYVPYMEFSFAADHWFYPSLLFLILYIAKKVSYYNSKNTKTILSLLVFFFLLKTLLINLSLTSTKSHLYKNLSEAPESTILYEYLIELEKRDKNFKKALILSEKVFPFSDNKIPLINNMFSFATELKSPTLQMKYLILKIKTYLHVNNISEAMRTMHSLPPELKSSEILYLRSLIRARNHKFTSEDLKSIDSILVD